MSLYACFTLMVAYGTWPYLWDNPLHKFIAAFGFMSDNPTHLPVLSMDKSIVQMSCLDDTFLFYWIYSERTGMAVVLYGWDGYDPEIQEGAVECALAFIALFLCPACLRPAAQPPMYDGFRHFLFMLRQSSYSAE